MFPPDSQEVIQRLEEVRQTILQDPSATLPEDISRMRQFKHKSDYLLRQKGEEMTGTAGFTEGSAAAWLAAAAPLEAAAGEDMKCDFTVTAPLLLGNQLGGAAGGVRHDENGPLPDVSGGNGTGPPSCQPAASATAAGIPSAHSPGVGEAPPGLSGGGTSAPGRGEVAAGPAADPNLLLKLMLASATHNAAAGTCLTGSTASAGLTGTGAGPTTDSSQWLKLLATMLPKAPAVQLDLSQQGPQPASRTARPSPSSQRAPRPAAPSAPGAAPQPRPPLLGGAMPDPPSSHACLQLPAGSLPSFRLPTLKTPPPDLRPDAPGPSVFLRPPAPSGPDVAWLQPRAPVFSVPASQPVAASLLSTWSSIVKRKRGDTSDDGQEADDAALPSGTHKPEATCGAEEAAALPLGPLSAEGGGGSLAGREGERSRRGPAVQPGQPMRPVARTWGLARQRMSGGQDSAAGPGPQQHDRDSQPHSESSSPNDNEEEEEGEPGDRTFTGGVGAFPYPFAAGMLPPGWPSLSSDMMLGGAGMMPLLTPPPVGPAAATRAMPEQVRVGLDTGAGMQPNSTPMWCSPLASSWSFSQLPSHLACAGVLPVPGRGRCSCPAYVLSLC